MTVNELIFALRKFPLDMRVVTPGFDEDGFSEVVVTRETIQLRLNVHGDLNGGGAHEIAREDEAIDCHAVLINFE